MNSLCGWLIAIAAWVGASIGVLTLAVFRSGGSTDAAMQDEIRRLRIGIWRIAPIADDHVRTELEALLKGDFR